MGTIRRPNNHAQNQQNEQEQIPTARPDSINNARRKNISGKKAHLQSQQTPQLELDIEFIIAEVRKAEDELQIQEYVRMNELIFRVVNQTLIAIILHLK